MATRILSDRAALGFKAKPQFNTSNVRGGGGRVFSNQVWALPLKVFEFAFNNSDMDDIAEIEDVFMDVRGGGGRFLMKDYSNYQLTAEIIRVATGGETTTQIIQNYGSDNPFSLDRKYIVSGSLTVFKNGVTFAASEADGLLTHAALSGADILSVTCQFYYKCRFLEDGYFVTVDGALGVYGRIESFTAEEDRS